MICDVVRSLQYQLDMPSPRRPFSHFTVTVFNLKDDKKSALFFFFHLWISLQLNSKDFLLLFNNSNSRSRETWKQLLMYQPAGWRGDEPAARRGILPQGPRLSGAVHTLHGPRQDQVISLTPVSELIENVVPSQAASHHGDRVQPPVGSVATHLHNLGFTYCTLTFVVWVWYHSPRVSILVQGILFSPVESNCPSFPLFKKNGQSKIFTCSKSLLVVFSFLFPFYF